MIFWVGSAVLAGGFVYLLRGTRRGWTELTEHNREW